MLPEAAERAGPPASPVGTAVREATAPAAARLLSSRRWGRAKGPHVENVVFLCHGMGSSAEGIIQIAPQLGALLETSLFVAPNGPEPVTAGAGRLWFDAGNRSPAALEAGVRGAAVHLNALIDAELDQAVYRARLGHGIDGSVVQAGKQFLSRSLAKEATLADPARPSPGG